MKTHQVGHLVAEESLAKVNLLALIITNILVKVVNCCGLLKEVCRQTDFANAAAFTSGMEAPLPGTNAQAQLLASLGN